MIKNFELIIGIEIHLEINSKTKMFSAIENNFEAEPNTLISPIDLGYPGTLPTINKEVVIKAIKLAKALNMEIDHELHFDRKNYFYSDLPKGYQITQQFRPIGKNGSITISKANDETKQIPIERIHMEEDTARQQHYDNQTLINYNRAGVPLIEIVSCPEIRSAEEAVQYIEEIQRIAKFLDISDAIMAKGSLRADINLSVRMLGTKTYGTRVEIKNLNSLNNVKTAIEYEYNLQVQKIINGIEIDQETKNFDESLLQTVSMRKKTDAIDYKYFPDPNIPVIALDQEWINNIKINELPQAMKKRYLSFGVTENYCNQIINNIDYAKFIDQIEYHDIYQSVKIFFSEIIPLEKKMNQKISSINIKPQDVKECLLLLEKGIISGKQLKQIIPLLVDNTSSINDLIEKHGFKLISDKSLITSWINEIVEKYPYLKNDYLTQKEKTLKFMTGEIMKISKGQANPILTTELIEEILRKN